MGKSTFADRLKEAMVLRNKRQSDIVSDTGIPKSALSQYISGKFEAKQDRVYLLAKYLNVSEAWLMGCDVPMDRNASHINNKTAPQLSEADAKGLEIFRKLSDKDKEMFLQLMADRLNSRQE